MFSSAHKLGSGITNMMNEVGSQNAKHDSYKPTRNTTQVVVSQGKLLHEKYYILQVLHLEDISVVNGVLSNLLLF